MKCIDNYSYDPTKKPLGKGAFGTVYKGIDEKTGKEVAIKVIPTDILQNQDYSEILFREIEVLRQIKGENIVQLLSTKQTRNNLYIFMEFCNGGDIEAYLRKNKKMSEEKALEIAYQFCKAFNTINNLNLKDRKGNKMIIMHRDLKTANVLFHDGKIKIADFGFAKMVDETLKDRKIKHTLLGTPLYMAPQILEQQPYTSKCDIWSTGLIIYECIYGVLPWEASSLTVLAREIKTQPLTFPKEISPDTKDLIQKMLEIHEFKRISWSEMMEHPAMRAVEARLNAQVQKQPKAIFLENNFSKEGLIGKPLMKEEPIIRKEEPLGRREEPIVKKEELIFKKVEPIAKKEDPMLLRKGDPIARKEEPVIKNSPQEENMTKPTIKRIGGGTPIDNKEFIVQINMMSDENARALKPRTRTPPKIFNRHTVGGGFDQRYSGEKTKKLIGFEENKKDGGLHSDYNIRELRINMEYPPNKDPKTLSANPPLKHGTTITTKPTTINLEYSMDSASKRKYLPIFSPIRKATEIDDPFAPWKLFQELK